MGMKIWIDVGHNSEPGDTGAVGLLTEDEVVKEVAPYLGEALEKLGHEAIIWHPEESGSVNESLALRTRLANEANADLFISLHCNAYQQVEKAMGTEVYAASTKGAQCADRIEKSLVNLGFKSRGTKNGSNLFVLRYTQCVAVLVELFFVDSQSDVRLYKQIGPQRIANAIAEAITNQHVAETPRTPIKSSEVKPALESIRKGFDVKNIDWSNPNCPISKYFRVIEATHGEFARTPMANSQIARNILDLAAELDKLREELGHPIGVTSWYRPPAINAAVGGVADSQHIHGCAADIYPLSDMDIYEFQNWVDERWFGALGTGAHLGFVHVDMRNKKGVRSGGLKGPRWPYS
jgi:N-acetylmuramoyl-L-alanine amidase/Peptidase M15